jgi:hypothetical protein
MREYHFVGVSEGIDSFEEREKETFAGVEMHWGTVKELITQHEIKREIRCVRSNDPVRLELFFLRRSQLFLCFQDLTHLCTKLRNRLLSARVELFIGERRVSLDFLSKLINDADMITMVKLDSIPLICSFVYSSRQLLATLSISDSQSPLIYLYDGKTLNIKYPIAVLSRLGHSSPVHLIGYSPRSD